MDTRGGGGAVTTVEDRWTTDDLAALRTQYEPLRRFAAVIGRWDVDPDDLVQEAYAKILVKDPAQIRDLGPYLRRTIANLATDERRRRSKVTSIMNRLNESGTRKDSYPSDLEDLMRLQPRVRALLFLVECDGHQIADAADAVGMTHS